MRAALVAILFIAGAVAGCLGSRGADEKSDGPTGPSPLPLEFEPYVVVATLDTGGNPFHPTWRREEARHPSLYIPGYPSEADALNFSFLPKFQDSVNASKPALELLQEKRFPYWVPGTNIVGVWAHPTDTKPFFDVTGTSHGHGSQASSQIAGGLYDHSIAPDAFIVIVDRTNDGATGTSVYKSNADALRWAADQPWIDVIHTNIQNPLPMARQGPGLPSNQFEGFPEAVKYAVAKGKLVVSAGGNFYAEFTETSPHAGPPGVLVAGANDNCGYTDYSNPDPHVVMDGMGTRSAQPRGYENGTFSGTSSASPRITGYAAQLLLEARRFFNDTQGLRDGALIIVEDKSILPTKGPLIDGRLTAAELHQVIRKTANPNPHASKFDGTQGSTCIPQPTSSPVAAYAKMGYGEVSEHTLPNALQVLLGQSDMPARPVEDQFYAASEAQRDAFWAKVPG